MATEREIVEANADHYSGPRRATESDLSAALAAMDPEQRQRVLVAAFGNDDPAGPVFKMMDEHHRDHHRSETKLQAELAAERAKVAELEAEKQALSDEEETKGEG